MNQHKPASNLEVYIMFKKDLSNYAFKVVVSGIIIIGLYSILPSTTDSTDDGVFDRSGMSLRIDHQTGCHYLGGAGGGLTPRLNKDGTHVCTGKDY
jgi:hypothetical protein